KSRGRSEGYGECDQPPEAGRSRVLLSRVVRVGRACASGVCLRSFECLVRAHQHCLGNLYASFFGDTKIKMEFENICRLDRKVFGLCSTHYAAHEASIRKVSRCDAPYAAIDHRFSTAGR